MDINDVLSIGKAARNGDLQWTYHEDTGEVETSDEDNDAFGNFLVERLTLAYNPGHEEEGPEGDRRQLERMVGALDGTYHQLITMMRAYSEALAQFPFTA